MCVCVFVCAYVCVHLTCKPHSRLAHVFVQSGGNSERGQYMHL